MTYVIEGNRLEKTFFKKRRLRELITRPFGAAERIEALRGVELRIRRGEIFGLLGPNGAGKTTLLKIFSCLVLPDGGRALVDGHDTSDERAVKPKIGLVHSDERSFYWRLSARQNLRFFARLYDVPSRRIDSRIDELLERFGMLEAADRPFADYSSGMKQKIAIARALLHDPPILLMDEPTRSLDPDSSLGLREFIQQELMGREGKTILLATHDLREAEALSDRLAILVSGRVRQVGTVAEVRRWGMQERCFALEVGPAPVPLSGPFRVVSEENGNEQRRVVVALDDGARFDEMMRTLLDAGVQIRSCDRVEPNLEEAFSRILESERAADAAGAAGGGD